MKLDTSPLGPVVRGERYKPVIPPKIEKAPPFTPPFTWTGDEAQFQALGDMTYPDLEGEAVNQLPETPTTFDWAVESAEPDKTINKIFDAVSNPELAAEPLTDSDLSWLDDPVKVAAVAAESSPGSESDARLNEPLDETPESRTGQPANPAPDIMENTELIESEPLLWDNPKAKSDRIIILGNKSIIYASPAESDMPHILGLFNEKKMMRDLLGENAGTIKLESIQRLTVNPKRTNLDIDYKADEKAARHQLNFISPQVRDKALDSMQERLGAGFTRVTRKFSLIDKILIPLLIIVLVAVIGWVLIAGLSYLEGVPAFQSGLLQLILVNVQYYVNLIGPSYILMIAVVLIALCLVWLLINLSRPSSLVIVERT